MRSLAAFGTSGAASRRHCEINFVVFGFGFDVMTTSLPLSRRVWCLCLGPAVGAVGAGAQFLRLGFVYTLYNIASKG